MSSIYLTEPVTSGKVLLETSFGDIDVELWSKEAPLACRNFVQLCLEGYFDNCPVHRVIKGFMVQTGDPTGTGKGGLSIWNKPFKDEFHGRIKFNHRGLVAMANEQKPHSNHSQFFITLDACEWLNKKNTIFGKVTGVTMFNLLRLNDVEVDEQDKPLEPIRIKRCQVLMNPFDDIVLRDINVMNSSLAGSVDSGQRNKEPMRKATRDLKLLSFGEQEEDDSSISAEAAVKVAAEKKRSKAPSEVVIPPPLLAQVVSDSMSESFVTSNTTMTQPVEVPAVPASSVSSASNSKEFQEARDGLLRSKRTVQALSSGKGVEQYQKEVAKPSLLTPLESLRQQYLKRKTDNCDREKETLERLNRFASNIKKSKSHGIEASNPSVEHYRGQVTHQDVLEGVEGDDTDWHAGHLKFTGHLDDSFRTKAARLDDYVVLDGRQR